LLGAGYSQARQPDHQQRGTVDDTPLDSHGKSPLDNL
jgi:hypothetical protein